VSSLLVSVIIPAFNAEPWIGETLQSVLDQTYEDLEILVIDDGSTDRTANVACAVLSRGRFPYRIIKQANGGLSSARNSGWAAARGTWIQFLDADDLLHPRKIALQIKECAEHGSVDVVYSDWQKIVWSDETWKPEDSIRTPHIGKNVLADLLKDENWQQVGSQMYNIRVLRAVGGYDKCAEPVEDMELCLRIAMENGIFVKAQTIGPVFWYRDRPGSLSKLSSVRRHVETCIKNAKFVEQYGRAVQDNRSETVDAIVGVYFGGARYFADRDWERFEQIVQDIEAFRPEFVPGAPNGLKILSRIVGYRRAERLAALYRRGKTIGVNCLRTLAR
jgi:glycosyltransferase involved in cell wall biosynthesis